MFGSDTSSAVACQSGTPVVKSKSRRHSPRPLCFEPLERREVLSASGFDGLRIQASFDVAIRGTSVEYSEMGLPAAMEGDVFTASGTTAGTNRIGHYEETLTPILVDSNGDTVPDMFVGTTGVSTFTFFVGSSACGSIGTITTANTSYIQGFTPEGQIQVGTQGTVVGGTILAGTRALSHLSGGFTSQSTVAFAPVFEMQTFVHFTIQTPLKPIFAALLMSGAKGHASSTTADSPEKSDDGSSKSHDSRRETRHEQSARVDDSHRNSGRHSNSSHHAKATDRNFEAGFDWSLDEVTERLSSSLHSGHRNRR